MGSKELEKKRDELAEGYSRFYGISFGAGSTAGWNACQKEMQERESRLIETLELLGTHMGDCECYCMDHGGLLKEALDKLKDGGK